MVIADVALMPLRSYSGEEEMYTVVDACIAEIKKAGGITIDEKLKKYR